MKRSGFKMKGYSYSGASPLREEKRTMSVSSEQTVTDKANIKENAAHMATQSQSITKPLSNAGTTKKSVKRQNRLETQDMSRSDIQAELKSRKKSGTSRSKKVEVGFLGRVFGGTKKLASKLAHQRNVSDI